MLVRVILGQKSRFRTILGSQKLEKSIFGQKFEFRPPKMVKNEGKMPKTTVFLMEKVYFGPKHHSAMDFVSKKSIFGQKSNF